MLLGGAVVARPITLPPATFDALATHNGLHVTTDPDDGALVCTLRGVTYRVQLGGGG